MKNDFEEGRTLWFKNKMNKKKRERLGKTKRRKVEEENEINENDNMWKEKRETVCVLGAGMQGERTNEKEKSTKKMQSL